LRNEPVRYDKPHYRRRSRIKIMFGRLKDWRRIATRYGRCHRHHLAVIN
jgi:transposase